MTATKIRLTCQECDHRWSVRPTAYDPECPKCGGVDWEVIEKTAGARLTIADEAGGEAHLCPAEAETCGSQRSLTPAEYHTNSAAVRERLAR